LALLESAPDEAVAIFDSIDNPAFRAMGLLEAAKALPEAERDKKLELLDRALLHARAAQEPTGIRVLLIGQVAEHWLDLGETDRATELLRATQQEAQQFPNDGWASYAKSAFAEELCQIDSAAALDLTKDLSDPRAADRHHGNIAHELAARNPAEAERVLKMVREPYRRDDYAVRVVYRMAAVDLERARRVAAAIEGGPSKAFALGMMALALAGSNRSIAQELLDEAYDAADQAIESAARATQPSLHTPQAVAAALLHVAEKIDPHLVAETIARTLSLRTLRSSGSRNARVDAQLALMIARYDRDAARFLIEPLTKHYDDILPDDGLVKIVMALIDPPRAVELVEAMPDDPGTEIFQPKNSARLGVANVLARHGERRWKHIQSRYLRLWVPDTEDHAEY
jgi:hypothetical protein